MPTLHHQMFNNYFSSLRCLRKMRTFESERVNHDNAHKIFVTKAPIHEATLLLKTVASNKIEL